MAFDFIKRFLPSWDNAANDVLNTYTRVLTNGLAEFAKNADVDEFKSLTENIGLLVFLQTVEGLPPSTMELQSALNAITISINDSLGISDDEVDTAIGYHIWYTSATYKGGFRDYLEFRKNWNLRSCWSYGRWCAVREKAVWVIS
jgi:hypothetical protein